ncbi:MAG: hypothetical protein LBV29_03110 [Azoarcus sp.]|jgi:hypothetical protein|nr:hypothetical protein [Azoarcus sp.]
MATIDATPIRGTKAARAKINLPANINAQMAEEVANIHNRIGAPTGDRIMVTQGKTFRLPTGAESDEFSAVIVDFISVNLYYKEAYERGTHTPPACYAMSFEPATLTPADKAPEKQGKSCAACWANQYGTRGKGKACQNTYLLALLATNATEDTAILTLKLSPTAIRSFDGYVNAVARKHGTPVRGVVTHFSFDDNSDYASIRLKDEGRADTELVTLAQSRLQEARDLLLAEPDTTVVEENKPAAPARRTARRA